MRLHRNSISGLSLIGLLLAASAVRGQSAASGAADDSPAASPQGISVSQLADTIFRETNAFRAANDRKPLQNSAKLAETARYFARFMARTQQYGHRADGDLPSDRAEKFGYEYCFVAENIAYQHDPVGSSAEALVTRFVDGWKASSGHRENLLAPLATETGIAVAPGEEAGRWYAVQMFGRPKSAAISFSIANRSDTLVRYTAGTREYELAPDHVRTHQECGEVDLAFDIAVSVGDRATLAAVDGAAYAVERSERGLAVHRIE